MNTTSLCCYREIIRKILPNTSQRLFKLVFGNKHICIPQPQEVILNIETPTVNASAPLLYPDLGNLQVGTSTDSYDLGQLESLKPSPVVRSRNCTRLKRASVAVIVIIATILVTRLLNEVERLLQS